MSAVARYALVSFLVVGLGCAVLLATLDEVGGRGALLAAGIAVPVQILAFSLLIGARADATRFLLWWATGIAIRVVVVVVAAVVSSGFDRVGRPSFVLSLIGFFFVLLLLEPVFLKGERRGVNTTA